MIKAIKVLTGILLAVAFSLASTAFAWATSTKELLFLPLFLLTLVGFIISFFTKKTGVIIIFIASLLWIFQLADEFGWFITFEPNNTALWGVVFLPIAFCIILSYLSVRFLFLGSPNVKKYSALSLSVALIIPIVGWLSYADKTYEQNVFAEFYQVENDNYKVIFRPSPADTRMIEVELASEEVRNLVLNKATFVANHHYFPNAVFKVKMTFDKIEEVELYKLEENNLSKPIRWDIAELKGETEFLK